MGRHVIRGDSAGGDLTGTYPNPTLRATANVETIIRANRLDQFVAPSSDLSIGSVHLINVADPTSAQMAATKGYVDSLTSGGVVFKGSWSAAINAPTLANGTGTTGWEYAVSAAGTVDFGAGGITFSIGDFVIYNGTIWQRIAGGSTNYTAGTGLTLTSTTFSLTTPVAVANGGTGTTTSTGTGSVVLNNSPNILTPTGIVAADVGLGSVTNDAQLKIASNLSDLASASTARTNLSVEPYGRTTVNNVSYTITTSNVYIAQTGTMSTFRTFTLPLANSVPTGWEVTIADESGTLTGSKYILIAAQGSDTIKGASKITMPYGSRRVISNGTNQWNVVSAEFINSNADITLPSAVVNASGYTLDGGGIRQAAGLILKNNIVQTKGVVYTTKNGSSSTITIDQINTVSWPDGQGVLNVNGTYDCPTAGRLNVATSTGTATIAYTGVTAGTAFTGCTYVSGATGTVANNAVVNNDVVFTMTDPFLGTALLIQNSFNLDYNGGAIGGTAYSTPYTDVVTGVFLEAPRAVVQLENTYTFTYGVGQVTGLPPAFQQSSTYTNTVGLTPFIAAAEGFVNAPTVVANTNTLTYPPVSNTFNQPGQGQGWALGFWDGPLHGSLNGGHISGVQIANYNALAFMGTNSSGTLRYGYYVQDVGTANNTGQGSMVTQVGVGIGNLQNDGITWKEFTGATNNIGLLNASTTMLTETSGATAHLIGAATQIVPNNSHYNMRTNSNASVTLSAAAAQVVKPNDKMMYGQWVVLVNTNTIGVITFTSGATTNLSLGAATRAVGPGGSLSLLYNNNFGRWIEQAFNPGGN